MYSLMLLFVLFSLSLCLWLLVGGQTSEMVRTICVYFFSIYFTLFLLSFM